MQGQFVTVEKVLTNILKKNGHGPFLFLGSGFSRRYLGLEDWEQLLKKFSEKIKPFEYYLSSSNSDLPQTASLMAEDYKDYWWSSKDTATQREKYKKEVRFIDSPLKIMIAEYVREISNRKIEEGSELFSELSELRKANVDGIITTNWDLFIESIFPEYETFIGQEELLVSMPQNIGEIYKIHGCSSKANSLVITHDDYLRFTENNPYLAAKLITIFVENPVIFMGYSLNDSNIKALLSSIVKGISKKHINKITKNLIFVQREKPTRTYGVKESILSLGDVDLPVTVMITKDFSEIYRALQTVEHKIPAKILRHCKQQLYNLVTSTNPSEQLCVVDYEDLDKTSDIDFVIGVGVKDRIKDKSYQAFSLVEIFTDIMKDDKKFDGKSLLDGPIKAYNKQSKYVPVFKYLKSIGITSKEEYDLSGEFSCRLIDEFKLSDFRSQSYHSCFKRDCNGKNVKEIVEAYNSDKASFLIPFIPWKEINIEDLKTFILANLEKIDNSNSNSTYSTYYRKLICLYDAIVNGWVVKS